MVEAFEEGVVVVVVVVVVEVQGRAVVVDGVVVVEVVEDGVVKVEIEDADVEDSAGVGTFIHVVVAFGDISSLFPLYDVMGRIASLESLAEIPTDKNPARVETRNEYVESPKGTH